MPPTEQLFESAMFHYARGMARAAKLNLDAAQQDLDSLERIAADPKIKVADSAFPLPGDNSSFVVFVQSTQKAQNELQSFVSVSVRRKWLRRVCTWSLRIFESNRNRQVSEIGCPKKK